MRVLMTGWFSFLNGEATAGDVLALAAVRDRLDADGVACDTAWSPVFRPGALTLDDADPGDYTHVVFACGPLHGPDIAALHERFAHCRRIAVGVSVLDPDDPAAAGFHTILARDGLDGVRPDLATVPPIASVPVVGVVLSLGQGEYGARRRHEDVADRITGWLAEIDCARLPMDTRLDSADWRLPATAGQLVAALARLDVVVTTRLHGLVLGLRAGTPVLAVDPVADGGKVTAQAAALGWPAVLSAADVLAPGGADRLADLWAWCLSGRGQTAARIFSPAPNPLLPALDDALRSQS
ncbi:polysaccharide pyruvyl transferase family protein [Actinomadura rayongensis]|uniref:Polysaccharide pyruvyl transferase family protein n=1 Tax=Actinomadura rayongensis TaxID=1429076 RepID=A0A6I4W7M6_9ACTN|nr:polysaccharide pyruvyl transferase family protein [Actinomadura rayongensis]MXQ64206.1 polysaccharide pyruvyl transferase family protein [Actinomadura rayongensis]